MANTTFKGPVRSQNGFQELVDGVWTPVGGGGGGGGVTYIPYTGSTNYTVTGLAAPGDSATLVWQFHIPQVYDAVEITTDAIPGTDGALFVITSVFPNDPVSGDFDFDSVQVFNESMYSGIATVTYAGNYTAMGNTFAVFVVNVTGFEP